MTSSVKFADIFFSGHGFQTTTALVSFFLLALKTISLIGSYALHTDPKSEANLVCQSVCQCVSVSVCQCVTLRTR